MPNDKKTLNKGLDALLGKQNQNQRSVKEINIEKIKPGRFQPRSNFDKEKLNELTNSIKNQGVLSPILVRELGLNEFEVIAGERRLRASKMAGLETIPCLVDQKQDQDALISALIENLQREDLNPIEEALGFKQLQEAFSQTQEQLSEALGKSRSYIANALRLLALPKIVLDWIQDGSLSVGHARAIITLKNPSQLARKIVVGGLTVRETERLVRNFSKKPQIKKPANVKRKPADTLAIEKQLSLSTGFNITVNHKDLTESGEVIISYDNLSDFDKLCELLS